MINVILDWNAVYFLGMYLKAGYFSELKALALGCFSAPRGISWLGLVKLRKIHAALLPLQYGLAKPKVGTPQCA